MKYRHLALLGAFALVAGCATEKVLIPTGGSRADGTVKLSYEYTMFEVPHVDMTQATTAAAQRCAAWGYSGSEPFGGQENHCEQSDVYGSCIRTMVTVEFQCTGAPPATLK